MSVHICQGSFRPYELIQNYQSTQLADRTDIGATNVFVGAMRDFNEGDAVIGMTLEYYPGMTEKHLQAIEDEARSNWTLLEVLIAHRVGEIAPGEDIVLVAVWSSHRKEAFEACRYVMEALKTHAPFWKKEQLQTHARWVERNTDGY